MGGYGRHKSQWIKLIDLISSCRSDQFQHWRPKLTFRESEELIFYLFI